MRNIDLQNLDLFYSFISNRWKQYKIIARRTSQCLQELKHIVACFYPRHTQWFTVNDGAQNLARLYRVNLILWKHSSLFS